MVHPDQNALMAEIWRIVGTITYRDGGSREAKILPLVFQSELVRVEFKFLTRPAPVYYRAGWINQVWRLQGKQHLRPGLVVPVAPSVFKFDADRAYQIRFNPVQYLFPCIVTFYRLV
jgi:hypothetical protein